MVIERWFLLFLCPQKCSLYQGLVLPFLSFPLFSSTLSLVFSLETLLCFLECVCVRVSDNGARGNALSVSEQSTVAYYVSLHLPSLGFGILSFSCLFFGTSLFRYEYYALHLQTCSSRGILRSTLVEQLLSGLWFLPCNAGIAHCDLKMENLVVDRALEKTMIWPSSSAS